MATIGVGKGSYIRPYRRVRMKAFPEDSSQTFIVGDPVILGSDSNEGNYIKIAAADPATDYKFLGFAASAANGVKGHMVDVWLATNDAEFVGHVSGAAAADDGLDNDDIGVAYGIVADSTNLIWRVDLSETTAPIARILELLDAHDDTNGRVVFNVIAGERVYNN
jgi:hypothetical protein